MVRKLPNGAQKSQPTVRLNVCLGKETKDRLIEDSYSKFGRRKGAISINLEHILRIHYGMNLKDVTET